MQALFHGSTTITEKTAFGWRVSAFLLLALISSQGCGIISDAPHRAPSTKVASPTESQTHKLPNDRPPTPASPVEVPSIAKIPSPPQTEQAPPVPKVPQPAQPTLVATGLASWYGPKFHGRRTASGEVFNQDKFTAAHPTLPWGTKVKVTNLANGKSVDVRINDRGPFGKGRIIDVSRAAARSLGMVGQGIANVQIEWLSDSEKTNDLVLQDK